MLNTVILAMDNYYNSKSTEKFLTLSNIIFSIIFTLEMLLKLQAYGVQQHTKDRFNLFDGVLVCISIIDHSMTGIGSDTGISTMNVFRTVRILRVFKLAAKSETIIILFTAIVKTLKDIAYLSCLLCLYIFICALLGRDIYAYTIKVNNIDE